MRPPFHYAFKVKDLASTRQFYGELMGCVEGRSTDTWVDFDFFGHQLSAHISNDLLAVEDLDYCGLVEGIRVPVPHFGCVLGANQFDKLKQIFVDAQVTFLVAPKQRYAGKTSQQQTMFVLDYSGNPLEFKCLVDDSQLFTSVP